MFNVQKKTVGLISSVTLAGLLLAGCSETSFKDSFDMGKSSPDETKVQANRSLTMPPDLQLRAPGGAGAPPQQVANTAPNNAPYNAPNNAPVVSTQPPQYGTVPPNGTAPQYGTTPQQPQRQAYIPPASQPATPRQDVYAKNGISRTRPDGTAKTRAELLTELRTLKKRQQQASNPNYGTIFNLPKVWRDESQ